MSGVTFEEISHIEELANLKQVRDKRTGRKIQLTKTMANAKTLAHTSIVKLRVGEVQKRLDEAKRSSLLFDALQNRYEELMKFSTEEEKSSEIDQGEVIRQENESLVNLLESILEKIELHHEGAALLVDLSLIAESGDVTSTLVASQLKKLLEQSRILRGKTTIYEDDEDIRSICQQLVNITKRILGLSRDSVSCHTKEPEKTISIHQKLKLELPKFDGNPLEWKRFSRLFTKLIEKDPTLSEEEKACHLMNAMDNSEAKKTVRLASDNINGFTKAMEALRQKYGKERTIYREHLNALLTPKVFGYNTQDLSNIYSHWQTHLGGLKESDGFTVSSVFATILESYFDDELKLAWTNHGMDSEKPSTIEKVLEFILEKANSELPQSKPKKSTSASSASLSNPPRKAKASVYKVDTQKSSTPQQTFKCTACKQEGHPLSRCDTFKEWSQEGRYQHVRDNKYCFNCLGVRHSLKECKSSYSCHICGLKHHTLLHKDSQPVMNISNTDKFLMSAIAMVTCEEYRQKARALMDGGSAISIITERLASRLKAKRFPHHETLSVVGVGLTSKSYVYVNLSSPHEKGGPVVTAKCSVVSRLDPLRPPPNPEKYLQLSCIKGKTPLADPHLGGELDLLLGIRDAGLCRPEGTTQCLDPVLTISKSIFGWAIGGDFLESIQTPSVYHIHPHEEGLDELLQRIWKLDQIPSTGLTTPSEDDKIALDHFQDSHQVLEDGRYSVQLPRKAPIPELGESRSIAVKRFNQNEKALKRTGHLQEFESVLQEYLTLEHAEIVPAEERLVSSSKCFYLPVHGVRKASSTTTKLRAVFDASAKTQSGVSLNDQLLAGPNLYPLLTRVLNRFRMNEIAITADISKMFREVALQPSERDYHRFLLRRGERLTDCRMKRLTFGVKSSPFIATQVLRQLSKTKREQYPQASEVINTAFYVDDCLTGAPTVHEADQLRQQLCELLSSAGMTLRKWRSNSKDFLTTVPDELQEKADLEIRDPLSATKTLGLHWNVNKDQLHISTPEVSHDATITKRLIASTSGKVFDILGVFSPATLPPKILLQRLWSLHLEWDTPVPEEIATLWKEWTSQLHVLSEHPIDRPFTKSKSKVIARQLHGFADASSVAYGCVVYLRTLLEDTQVITTLITAKSRVAPLQTVTIPRLELTAAHLLAKLMDSVATDLDIPNDHLYAWTDSLITLCWIRKSPSNLKTFVANRVSQIQTIIPQAQWRHVSTHDNPADLSSRGTSPETLVKSHFWWKGPTWLSKPPTVWPTLQTSPPREIPDIRTAAVMSVQVKVDEGSLWYRFSSFTKLVRVIAWCRRFVYNCRNKHKQHMAPILTSQETESTKKLILGISQRDVFADIIQLLHSGKPVPKSQPLHKYNLHLLEDRILTVRSRVRDDNTSNQPRLYVILSLRSPIVRLFVRTLHQEMKHPGTSTLLATLAEDFYIVGIKSFLKSVSRNCVICQRAYLKTSQQQMGMLPVARTQPSPPFHHTGLDFAGPFTIKRGSQRKPTRIKVYVCLFVCMATRAVHLELCSDLTSDAFLATLSRFCGCRGTPAHFYSDHGRNFVGARNEMLELQTLLKSDATQQQISHMATTHNFQWHFIPARTPHFGGVWEAGVKAMKTILRKNLTPHLLTFEELSTVLVQAEAILNSRPILSIDSTEANGPTSLTAGHFLIGRPLIAPPHSNDNTTNISLLKRWNLVERLNIDLWIQWRSRYLQSLQSRSKWQKSTRNFQVGDIVLLKDDTLMHRSWPLGRITETFAGDDGLVRVVNVLCNGKVYRRAINRLVLLIDDHSSPPQYVQASLNYEEEFTNSLMECIPVL